MTLKLKSLSNPPSPFSWDVLPSPSPQTNTASLPSPPTSWLSARDMKLFGAEPLVYVSKVGLVKCKDCDKPIIRSFITEHTEKCAQIRSGLGKGAKGKGEVQDPGKGPKKRRASLSPSDPSLPPKKKPKPLTKGRYKGPVDYDKQCGVINDRNLPCSRSLTCKTHSMGAKRAVQGRSKKYDELLVEWQRANNPNYVEPVKKETKAEKKEKREREKLEKKRLAAEAAAAMGIDPNSTSGKKSGISGAPKKVGKKAAAAAAAAAVRLAEGMGEDIPEDLDDLDSEAEVDELVRIVRVARDKGVVGTPLAVPCDAGSWFVQRRERARCCRDLLAGALGTGGSAVPGGIGGLVGGLAANRSGLPGGRVP